MKKIDILGIIERLALVGFVVAIVILYTKLEDTKESLQRVEQRALKNQNDINAGQGLNIQLFQLEQRVENTENWIWNFEDIMFGPAESPSINNVGE